MDMYLYVLQCCLQYTAFVSFDIFGIHLWKYVGQFKYSMVDMISSFTLNMIVVLFTLPEAFHHCLAINFASAVVMSVEVS